MMTGSIKRVKRISTLTQGHHLNQHSSHRLYKCNHHAKVLVVETCLYALHNAHGVGAIRAPFAIVS